MTIRLEAETFTGVGAPGNFSALALAGASGGSVIAPKRGRTGQVEAVPGVAAGLYKVRVVYYDETDGISSASLALDGLTLGSWQFDGIAGTQLQPGAVTGIGAQPGNRRAITFDEVVSLDALSRLTLTATQNANESARFDYVELIEVFAPTDLTLAGPAVVGQGVAGAVIGALLVSDADATRPADFAVDDARFEIVDGVLRLRAGVALDLADGPEVALTITATDADGLSYSEAFTIDVLETAPLLPDITLTALDLAQLPDRLVFRVLDRLGGRVDKRTATARIENNGDADLTIEALQLDGFFEFLDPSLASGFTLAAGASIEIGIRFDAASYQPGVSPEVFHGALRVLSNDADEPIAEIALAGFWSERPEADNEASANETFEVFGFGNRLPFKPTGRNLPTDYRYEATTPEEVMTPFWKIADGVESVSITRIGAFVTNEISDFAIYNPDSNFDRSASLRFTKAMNSTFLPQTETGGAPTLTFSRTTIPDSWEGNDLFGIVADNTRTNHYANSGLGHGFRVFQALDADGNAIANTWLGTQDGVYGNEDFNDSIFLIVGATPVFGVKYGSNGNDALLGTDGDDYLAGEGGNDILDGLAGDDFMIGDGGADTFEGGEGNDTVSYKWSFGVTVNLATGFGQDGDVYRSIETAVGSNGNDRLTASSAGSTLEGSGGSDTLQGGTGFDTVSYAGSTGAVTVSLATQSAFGGHANGDVLTSFEGVIGSAFNDTLIGGGGNNVLAGGAGADRLTGNGGLDVFVFGADGPNGTGDVITDLGFGDRVRVAGSSTTEVRADGTYLLYGSGALALLSATGNVVIVTDATTPAGFMDYALG